MRAARPFGVGLEVVCEQPDQKKLALPEREVMAAGVSRLHQQGAVVASLDLALVEKIRPLLKEACGGSQRHTVV